MGPDKKLTYKDCERKIVQLLAGNDAKIRRVGLKKLKILIRKRPGECTEAMEAYWKGLHYCMWMCDKPIPQEDLANELCSILGQIPSSAPLCQRAFIASFFETEVREWVAMDQWRVDKFMMLVRRFFRQCLAWLAERQWPSEDVEWFCLEVVQKLIFRSKHLCLGLQMFMVEITFDELKTYYESENLQQTTESFVKLLCNEAAHTTDSRMISQICKEVFDQFLLGFVAALEEKEEDPSVDWSFPLSVKRVSEILFSEASATGCPPVNRKRLYGYVKRFEELCETPQKDLDKKFWQKVYNKPGSMALRLESWAAPKHRKRDEKEDLVEKSSSDAFPQEKSEEKVAKNAEKPEKEKTKIVPLWSKKNGKKEPTTVRQKEAQPAYIPLEKSEEKLVEEEEKNEEMLKSSAQLEKFVAEPPAFFKGAVEKASRKRKTSKA